MMQGKIGQGRVIVMWYCFWLLVEELWERLEVVLWLQHHLFEC